MSMFPSYAQGRPENVPADRVVDFDIYAPPGVEADFHRSWKDFQDRATADLVWTPRNGGHWIVTRGRPVNEILADYERFSSRYNIVPKPPGRGLPPLNLDPPKHRDYRVLLNDSLSLRAVMNVEGRIRELSRELIDPMVSRGRCDFSAEYADIFPIRIFAAIMGLPLADTPRLKYLTDQYTRPDTSMNRREVMVELMEYMRVAVEGRRGAPSDDLLTRFAIAEIDGAPLSVSRSADLCVQVMFAGLDTVVNFLGFTMHFLAICPEERRALAEDRGKIANAVGELFRRFPLVVTGRCVTTDTEYDGVVLREGDMVLLPTVMHGLDDREHDDPMAYDLGRRRRTHSTFGNGPHKCPGSHLGLLEVRITLEEWLARIPEFRLADDAAPRCEGGMVGSLRDLKLAWA